MVILIIVMLILPSDLTYAQLNQIKVGMTLQDAVRLLGDPDERAWTTSRLFDGDKPGEIIWLWTIHGEWGKPTLTTMITYHHKLVQACTASCWVGKTHLLFIHSDDDDAIVNVCIVPIHRTGGGLRSCFDSICEYWNDWRRKK